MRLKLTEFTASHVDAAAELLAVNREEARAAEPAVPAEAADPRQCAEEIEARLGEPGASGIVALSGSRVKGYLIGTTSANAWGRSAQIVSHAVEPDGDGELYRDLYAAIAPRWLADGFFRHDVAVLACDRRAIDAWFSLGFGRQRCQAIRETVAPPNVAVDPSLILRMAGPEDFETVVHFALALQSHHSTSPMFQPRPIEAVAARRVEAEELVADQHGAVWLAERDGEALGIMAFHSPHPMIVAPARTIYLAWGFTEPGLRGRGIGRALLARSLEWAAQAGYDWCLLNFHSSNVSGSRFWLSHGFRLLACGLHRTIDERIAWAHP